MNCTVRRRQGEFDWALVAVQHQEQRCLDAELANAGLLRAAVQQHAETAHRWITPVRVLHLLPVGINPGEIFNAKLFIRRRSEIGSGARSGIAGEGE